jgi:prepilin-type N-terminal cleavage/methylation domain-containing protein
LGSATAGFTLIEVIIVLVILTFISLGIYQMTTETFKLRDELSAEGDFYNGIRMAMDVLQRDVASMFSPILSRPDPNPSGSPTPQNPNTLPPPVDPQTTEMLLNSDQGKTSAFWLAATDKSGLRLSRFVGTPDKITFVSASHVRVYKDSPESDFAKITYELVSDEENKGNKDMSDPKALLRTENTDAFDDDDRKAERYAHHYLLLHGIRKLRFRFWRKDKDNGLGRWENSWDNDKEDFKERYPDKIEVSIEVDGPQHLSYTGVYYFRPEVPLNGLVPST